MATHPRQLNTLGKPLDAGGLPLLTHFVGADLGVNVVCAVKDGMVGSKHHSSCPLEPPSDLPNFDPNRHYQRGAFQCFESSSPHWPDFVAQLVLRWNRSFDLLTLADVRLSCFQAVRPFAASFHSVAASMEISGDICLRFAG